MDTVTERINRDVRMSMDTQPHAIPPIEPMSST